MSNNYLLRVRLTSQQLKDLEDVSRQRGCNLSQYVRDKLFLEKASQEISDIKTAVFEIRNMLLQGCYKVNKTPIQKRVSNGGPEDGDRKEKHNK